tara:strand:+ start:96 stop:449 length:354 start_codon:yes stop_codon:yes gene_type:complete
MSTEPVPELENVDEESVDENVEFDSEISEDDIDDTESFIDETELVMENSDDLEMSENENEDDEYDDEHDPFMGLGNLLSSVLISEEGETLCSALVNISRQLEVQNKIMIKMLSHIQK